MVCFWIDTQKLLLSRYNYGIGLKKALELDDKTMPKMMIFE